MRQFKRIYDVKNDMRKARLSWKTTQETNGGLDYLNGMLCYSKQWQDAIDKGLIKKTVVEGEISDVFMSGHNDYPQFEIAASGEKSDWVRYGTETYIKSILNNRFYKVGNKVKLAYVLHPWKPGHVGEKILGTHCKVVTYVEICPK